MDDVVNMSNQHNAIQHSYHATPLQPDVGSAVAARVADFMSKGWTVGLVAKIDAEILIEFKTAVHIIDVNLEHHGTMSVKTRPEEI